MIPSPSQGHIGAKDVRQYLSFAAENEPEFNPGADRSKIEPTSELGKAVAAVDERNAAIQQVARQSLARSFQYWEPAEPLTGGMPYDYTSGINRNEPVSTHKQACVRCADMLVEFVCTCGENFGGFHISETTQANWDAHMTLAALESQAQRTSTASAEVNQ